MIIDKLLNKIRLQKIENEKSKENNGKVDKQLRIERLRPYQFQPKPELPPREKELKELEKHYRKIAEKNGWTNDYFNQRIAAGRYVYGKDPRWLREYFHKRMSIINKYEISPEESFRRMPGISQFVKRINQ